MHAYSYTISRKTFKASNIRRTQAGVALATALLPALLRLALCLGFLLLGSFGLLLRLGFWWPKPRIVHINSERLLTGFLASESNNLNMVATKTMLLVYDVEKKVRCFHPIYARRLPCLTVYVANSLCCRGFQERSAGVNRILPDRGAGPQVLPGPPGVPLSGSLDLAAWPLLRPWASGPEQEERMAVAAPRTVLPHSPIPLHLRPLFFPQISACQAFNRDP